jgi:hypothetical protein
VAAVLEHLDQESPELYAQGNDDRYGPDLVVWRGFKPAYYIEVEQRTGWKSGPWPESWAEVHIPERKGKFISLSLPCEIWVLSADAKAALIIPEGVIRQHGQLKEFSNAKIESGELFYFIPVSECIQLELSSVPGREAP